LKNNLSVPPHVAQLVPLQVKHRLAGKGHMPVGRFDQSQDGASDRGFATPTFAHQPQRAAPLQREINPIDRADPVVNLRKKAAANRKVLDQPFDFQQRLGGARDRCGHKQASL
jgi:hypothetical protein